MHVVQCFFILCLYYVKNCYILPAPKIAMTEERDGGHVPVCQFAIASVHKKVITLLKSIGQISHLSCHQKHWQDRLKG